MTDYTLRDALRDLRGDDTIALSDGAQDWYADTLLDELAHVRQGEEDEDGKWHPEAGDLELNRAVSLTREGIFYLDDRGNAWFARPDFEIRHGLWNDDGDFEEGEEPKQRQGS